MDHPTRRGLLVGAAAAAAATATAQTSSPAPPPVTRAALREDAAVLKRAFEALHPGLPRYLDSSAQAAAWSALDDDLARVEDRKAAYLAFSRFTSKVCCGHTFLNPANQGRLLREEVLESGRRLPVLFRWIDGRMVVTRSFPVGLAPGDAIESIDGTPVGRLLAAMLPLSRTDGSNTAKRIANLDVIGTERHAAFDVFLPLLQPLGDVVRLRVRAPTGALRTAEVATQIWQSRREASARPDMEGDANPFTFGIGSDGVGVLTLPTWALYNSRFGPNPWLDARLDDLIAARGRGLVLDLRGNEGGQDIGDHIAARLIDRPLSKPRYLRRTRYRAVPAELNPVLDTWDDSFRDWGAAATGPDAGGYWRMTRFDDGPDGDQVQPRSRRFAGPVAVLVDASNSSATFQFAQYMQAAGRAKLVGRPTGGNRRGINGGAFFFLRLPNSRVEIDLPLVGTFPDRPQPDAGLTPDVPVAVTAGDLAARRDPDLEAARRTLLA